jgi:hypothetical protein
LASSEALVSSSGSSVPCTPDFSLNITNGVANYHGRQTFLGARLNEEDVFQVQIYQRTANIRNNYPVWQGLTNPEWYISRDTIPVSIVIDPETGTRIHFPEAIAADSLDAWKISRSPLGIDAIPPGFVVGEELVRGSEIPVANSDEVLIGVIPKGLPAYGLYFSGSVLVNCELMLFDKFWVSPEKNCSNIGCQDCFGYNLSTVGTLEHFLDEAETLCSDEGGVIFDVIIRQSQDVTNPALNPQPAQGSSSSGIGGSSSSAPTLFIEGTVCCRGEGLEIKCAINQPSSSSGPST